MTTRQMKPRKLPEDDRWSQTPASLRAWGTEWAEGKTRLAIRQGDVCGFCAYSPEKQTAEIRNKRLRQLTKQELLLRHMRNHYDEGHQRSRWEHPPEKSGSTRRRSSDFANSTEFYDRERTRRFPHRGWIKSRRNKP